MGFLKRIFGKLSRRASAHTEGEKASPCITSEYAAALAFNRKIGELLSSDRYLARSDYHYLYEEYKKLMIFFKSLAHSDMLTAYVAKNHLDLSEVTLFLERIEPLADLSKEPEYIYKHNCDFVANRIKSEESYLDDILKACDPNIKLDKEQREVVVADEDYSLVIAGAGAGKTTTVAAKVSYLVERQKVKPEEILVISFTNKAVNELKERINGNLNIPCPISTFHKVGLAVLKKDSENNKRIVDNGYLYTVLCNYLKTSVLKNAEMVRHLVLFFSSYISAPYEGDNVEEYFKFLAEADFSTLKSNLHEYIGQVIDHKTHRVTTLNNEVLRSQEEVNIANFLYLNQIEYDYEPVYQYRILESRKPYTPDFVVWQGEKRTYIEHFGITENGVNNMYSAKQLEQYRQRINEKIRLHRLHKTDLIYTFSKFNDGRTYLEHLQEELERRGYQLRRRSDTEVYKQLVETEESKYISRLAYLLCTFISNFKTQGYGYDKFDKFIAKTKNVRTRLFLEICKNCYLEYQQLLETSNSIDFQDMINLSAKIIADKQLNKEQLGFRYIIVDEYQDISRQRYKLIRNLSELCNAKIMAVGDDWQSIYAFSGSILPLFTHFCEEFGYGRELKITRTYRNAQELINIAGNFVQRNNSQIRKKLISNKRIDRPVIIATYKETAQKNELKGGRYRMLGEAVNKAIRSIIADYRNEGKAEPCSILLIGRYGFDVRNLCKSPAFNYNEKTNDVFSVEYGTRVKLSYLTAHSSKGLSADNVIIINAKDETYGFPSKVDDDPVLNLVVCNDNSYNYAEERRLFYVALTRTKNRVYIVTPESRPSDFIKELLRDTEIYPKVQLVGNLKSDIINTGIGKYRCPICGYPMQLRMNKNYGLRLWICTNDQEVCGFMTNDRHGGTLSIKKCDWCNDGYLVVKKNNNNNNYFLGCTNYKNDGSGCSRLINHAQYAYWNNNKLGIEDKSACKPSFFKQPTQTPKATDLPPLVHIPTQRKGHPNEVYKTTIVQYTMGDRQFGVIADANGKIITNLQLLQELHIWRIEMARQFSTQPSVIISDKNIVELATHLPTTKQELLATYGMGERRVKRFGDQIIKFISEYLRTR